MVSDRRRSRWPSMRPCRKADSVSCDEEDEPGRYRRSTRRADADIELKVQIASISLYALAHEVLVNGTTCSPRLNTGSSGTTGTLTWSYTGEPELVCLSGVGVVDRRAVPADTQVGHPAVSMLVRDQRKQSPDQM